MPSYLYPLKSLYTKKTFKRKLSYIRYNFGPFIKNANTLLEIGPGMGEFIYFLNEKRIFEIDIVDNDQSIINFIKKNYKIKRPLFYEPRRYLLELCERGDLFLFPKYFKQQTYL